MSNIKKYETWEASSAQHEKEELGRISSTQFLKLKQGENILRFLPPPTGQKSPFVVIFQHFIQVPGQPKAVTFTCPRMMAKRPCPACTTADKFRNTGNPADYDRAGQFLARVRVFANVVDRENPELGPQVLGMGKGLYDQLLSIRANTRTGGDFTNPSEDGFDIIIQKTGSGKLDTRYQAFPDRNASPLGNMDWIDVQTDLTRYSRVMSDEEIAGLIEGATPASVEDATPRGRSLPKKRTMEDDALETDDS